MIVAIDIDATTLAFARENLERAGYADVILVHGDGGMGYTEHAPYERICVTAACPVVPHPLIEQLVPRGGSLLASWKVRVSDSRCSSGPPRTFGARSSRRCSTCRCRDATA
jgi:protein-L-isoaspartate O-methyltransferase